MAFTLLELDHAPFFLSAACNMPHTTTTIDLVIQSDPYHEIKAELPSYESLA